MRSGVKALGIGAALLLAAPGSPVLAQDWAEDVRGWTVGRSGDFCGMTMVFEGQGATEVALMIRDPASETFLVVSNYGWSAVPGEDYEMRFGLGEWTYTQTAIGTRMGSRRGFMIAANERFLSDMASANSLVIVREGTLVDQLSLAGSAAALQVLERCRRQIAAEQARANADRERLAHIPRDPFAPAEPPAPPVPIGASPPVPLSPPESWLGPEDYPVRALRLMMEGSVSILLHVDPHGRVDGCRVTASSGHAVLDEAACDVARRRARFEPARDEHGFETAGNFSTTLRYAIN